MFLTVTVADFALQLVMGVAVTIGIEDSKKPLYGRLFEARDYNGEAEVGIAVGVFSALCLSMVAPLWYVQLTNILKNTTTYARFAHKPRSLSNSSLSPVGGQQSLLSSPSDTASMLKRDEDTEWTHFFSGTSLTKSLSFRERIQIVQRKACCGLLTKKEYVGEHDSKAEIVMEEGKVR